LMDGYRYFFFCQNCAELIAATLEETEIVP
jgi:hypothetical protein